MHFTIKCVTTLLGHFKPPTYSVSSIKWNSEVLTEATNLWKLNLQWWYYVTKPKVKFHYYNTRMQYFNLYILGLWFIIPTVSNKQMFSNQVLKAMRVHRPVAVCVVWLKTSSGHSLRSTPRSTALFLHIFFGHAFTYFEQQLSPSYLKAVSSSKIAANVTRRF